MDKAKDRFVIIASDDEGQEVHRLTRNDLGAARRVEERLYALGASDVVIKPNVEVKQDA